MELYERVEKVKSRNDLIKFINHLRMDLKINKDDWENVTLEDFLEAMEAWVNDMEGLYLNSNEPIPKQPSWKTIGDMLYA